MKRRKRPPPFIAILQIMRALVLLMAFLASSSLMVNGSVINQQPSSHHHHHPIADTSLYSHQHILAKNETIQVFVVEQAPSFNYSSVACTSPVYCYGALLDKVQMARLFRDPKQFVDMPTNKDPYEVLKSFKQAMEHGKLDTEASLRAFLMTHFHRVGYDLQVVVPKDWVAKPQFTDKLGGDSVWLALAVQLHEKWAGLTRTFNREHLCPDCATTSLLLPNPFVIPGGRFREFYYWDTFWIQQGLLVSGMCDTVRGILENMIVIVEAFGYVPNGSRLYYLNRSQPPMFAQMLLSFKDAGSKCQCSIDWTRALNAVDREYEHWMSKRITRIKGYTLNVYGAALDGPRPESYPDDLATAEALDPKQRPWFHKNIAASAESGWDFSARWFGEDGQMTSIETGNRVPLDLNCIMYVNEQGLSRLHSDHGKQDKAQFYKKAAKTRRQAILTPGIFWDSKQQGWSDHHLTLEKPVGDSRAFYLSDLSPLFFLFTDQNDFVDDSSAEDGSLPPRSLAQLALYLKTHVLDKLSLLKKYPGGVPVSELVSGQQWDYPNVWAPLQYMLVEWYEHMERMFVNTDLSDAFRSLRTDLVTKWCTTVLCSLRNHGHVFEKYHAERIGCPGGGGEYIVQEGFGWTNGVTLWMLDKFNRDLPPGTSIQCPLYANDNAKPITS